MLQCDRQEKSLGGLSCFVFYRGKVLIKILGFSMKSGAVGLLILKRIGNQPAFISAGRKGSPIFNMIKS